METIRLLINRGAVMDKLGAYALRHATVSAQQDIVELLLERGVDPNTEPVTPLMLAAYSGRTELVRLLVAAGADANYPDKNGWTPLMFAADAGHTNTVQFLLEHGANTDTRTKSGKNAIEIVRFNLERGALSEVLGYDPEDAEALDVAFEKRWAEVVVLLSASDTTSKS